MSKQDRQGARTASDLERKYSFGKSFAEVYEIATGARTTAEEAKSEVTKVGKEAVKSVTPWYCLSSSTETLDEYPVWSPTPPVWEEGKYMWQKNITTYTNGETVEGVPVCIAGAGGQPGANGVGVANIATEFYLSYSKTEQLGGSWQTTMPTWNKGMYLWTRSIILYTDDTVEYTTPYCDTSWEAVNELDASLNAEEVFKRLTEDGTLQGLYREDGQLYINAEYIKSGIYTGEKEIFLEPGQPEVDKCWQYAHWILEQTPEAIALFDFYGDGEIGEDDAQAAEDAMNGNGSLAGSPIAKLSKVKIQIDVRNPTNTISFSATNMWGRVLDYSIGINNPVFTDDGRGNLYRIVDGEKEWLNPPIGVGGANGLPIGMELDGTPYRTVERDCGHPIYKRVNTDIESGLYGEAEYGYSNSHDAKWYPLYPQDGIVETWQQDGWTCRKWHSGVFECWQIAQHTAASSDFVSYTADLPVELVETPHVVVSAGANGGWIKDRYPYSNSNEKNKIAITYRNASANAILSDLHIHVTGRWK